MLTRALQSIKSSTQRLSTESLTRRASFNMLAILLDFVARLAVGFFTNPYLVRILGDYLYGVWQILARLVGYTSVVSGRPSIALKWTIARLQSSEDYTEKKRNVGSAVMVWLVFLPLLGIGGGVIAWFAPTFLKSPEQYTAVIRLATAFLVFGMITQGLAEIPRAVLQGENMEYKRMGASALIVLAGGGLTIAALYLDTGIAGVAFVFSLMFLIQGSFFLQVARSNIAWFGFQMPSSIDVRRFLSLNWWYIGWQILILLLMSSDVVLLGLLLSPEKVSVYSITKYAPDLVISMTVIVNAGVLPGLGKILSTQEFEKASSLRREILTIIWAIGIAASGTALLWNRSFVSLWIGADYYTGVIPLTFMVIKTIQLAMIMGDAGIIDLSLDVRKKVLFAVISLITSFTVATILVQGYHLGYAGLCLGFIVGQSVLSVAYPRIVAGILRIEHWKTIVEMLRSGAVSAILLMGAAWAGERVTAGNWIVFMLSAGMTFILFCACIYQFGLAKELRERLFVRLGLSLHV